MTRSPHDRAAPAVSDRASGPVATLVSTLARLVLAGVLGVAGALKAADPGAAVQAVRGYRLLPAGVDTAVGWALPFLEIALALLLLAGLLTRVAAVLTALLLVAFVAAVTSAAARGLSIDCGCFGGGGTVAPGQTGYAGEIGRDAALLAVAAWLVLRPRSRWAVDRSEQEETA